MCIVWKIYVQSGFIVHVICIDIFDNSFIKGSDISLYFDRTNTEPDLKQMYI